MCSFVWDQFELQLELKVIRTRGNDVERGELLTHMKELRKQYHFIDVGQANLVEHGVLHTWFSFTKEDLTGKLNRTQVDREMETLSGYCTVYPSSCKWHVTRNILSSTHNYRDLSSSSKSVTGRFIRCHAVSYF